MSWFSFSSDNSNFFTNIGTTISALSTGILSGIGLVEQHQDKTSHQPDQESSRPPNGSSGNHLVEDKKSPSANPPQQQSAPQGAPKLMEVPNSLFNNSRNNSSTRSSKPKTSLDRSQSGNDPVMSLVDKSIEQGRREIGSGHPHSKTSPKPLEGKISPDPQALKREETPKDLQSADDARERVMQGALRATEFAQQARDETVRKSMGIHFPPSSVPRERIGVHREITARRTKFNNTDFIPILTYQVKITENEYLRLYVDDSANFAMKIGTMGQNGKFEGSPVRNQEDIFLNDDARSGLRIALSELERRFYEKKPRIEDRPEDAGPRISEFKHYIYTGNIKYLTGLSFRNINTLTAHQNAREAHERGSSRFQHPSTPSTSPQLRGDPVGKTSNNPESILDPGIPVMFMGKDFMGPHARALAKIGESRSLNMTADQRAREGDVSFFVEVPRLLTPSEVERQRSVMGHRYRYEQEIRRNQSVTVGR